MDKLEGHVLQDLSGWIGKRGVELPPGWSGKGKLLPQGEKHMRKMEEKSWERWKAYVVCRAMGGTLNEHFSQFASTIWKVLVVSTREQRQLDGPNKDYITNHSPH